MTNAQQPQPPDAPVDYLYADQFGVHHVCDPHIDGAFPVYRHQPPAGASVDAQSSFTVELTSEQEKAFSKWVRGVKTTPWQRSVARLAFLLNHTQRGLIDYAAAQHFANELASRAALENAPVADGPVPFPKREDITPDMRAGFERLFSEVNKHDHSTLARNEQGAYRDLRVAADWVFYQRAWADALASAPIAGGGKTRVPGDQLGGPAVAWDDGAQSDTNRPESRASIESTGGALAPVDEEIERTLFEEAVHEEFGEAATLLLARDPEGDYVSMNTEWTFWLRRAALARSCNQSTEEDTNQ